MKNTDSSCNELNFSSLSSLNFAKLIIALKIVFVLLYSGKTISLTEGSGIPATFNNFKLI